MIQYVDRGAHMVGASPPVVSKERRCRDDVNEETRATAVQVAAQVAHIFCYRQLYYHPYLLLGAPFLFNPIDVRDFERLDNGVAERSRRVEVGQPPTDQGLVFVGYVAGDVFWRCGHRVRCP